MIKTGDYFILDIGNDLYIPLRATIADPITVDYSPAYENSVKPLAPNYITTTLNSYSQHYLKKFSFKMAQITAQGTVAPDLFNMNLKNGIIKENEIFEVGLGIEPSPLRVFLEYPVDSRHGEYSVDNQIIWGDTYDVFDFGYVDGFMNPSNDITKFYYFIPNQNPNFHLLNPTSNPITPYFSLKVNKVKVSVPSMGIIMKMFSGQSVNGLEVANIYRVPPRNSSITWAAGTLGVTNGVPLNASQNEIASALGVTQ